MGRRLVLALLGCAALFALAGCGGGKKHSTNVYSRGPVIKCLRGHDFTVSTSLKDVNFIAWSAPGGGLRAWENGTHHKVDLILAFGHSVADARQTMKAVRRYALRPPIFRYRIIRANVVILWAYRPSKKKQALLLDCLNRSV
jgi:hypothetical protein